MKYILIFVLATFLTSCNWLKQKTKATIHKSGEVVAKTGSEFADGVSEGVEKTFKNEVVISDELKGLGLKSGKIIINSSDSTTDNILTTYLIFDKPLERKVNVKVYDENGQEYGRTNQDIKGRAGEAHYIDFVFDRRTNINGKGKVTFE